jgi:hypothetical protein
MRCARPAWPVYKIKHLNGQDGRITVTDAWQACHAGRAGAQPYRADARGLRHAAKTPTRRYAHTPIRLPPPRRSRGSATLPREAGGLHPTPTRRHAHTPIPFPPRRSRGSASLPSLSPRAAEFIGVSRGILLPLPLLCATFSSLNF